MNRDLIISVYNGLTETNISRHWTPLSIKSDLICQLENSCYTRINNTDVVSKVQVRVAGVILLILAYIVFMPDSNSPNYGQAIYTLVCGSSLLFVVPLVIIDTWRLMLVERRKQTDRVVREIVESTPVPPPVLSDKD